MSFVKKKKVAFDRLGNATYYVDGAVVTKEEFDGLLPEKPLGCPLAGHLPACWPQVSEALAVHPDQVQEGNVRNKRHGISARYQPGTGLCVIPDRDDRSKLMRLEGVHDKHAGYGD